MCKYLVTFSLLTCFAWPVQAQFATDRRTEQPKPAQPDANMQMLRDLQEARELVKRMPASGSRDRAELLLTRIELQLKETLGRLPSTAPKPKPISNQEFNQLSVSVRNQAFDKDKYQFLENSIAGRHFTSDQAGQLLKHFSFDADRIRAAVLLYPQLTDAENFPKALDSFIFETSRKQVMDRIMTK